MLHAFTGGTDGREPMAGLVRDQAGNLYGTSLHGGDLSCTSAGCGVIFKVSSDGTESVLHTFGYGGDGMFPRGDLVRDKAGNLYGTTIGGGSGWGTLFELDSAGNETVLYSFPIAAGGEYPVGPLVRDAQGNFYGVTSNGGDPACGCGVVFKIDATGHETVIHAFTGKPDGAYPYSGLTRDGAGNFYGTTYAGGSTGCNYLGCGTVFKIDPNGTETILHAFTGNSDGSIPFSALIVDKSGTLYGTASSGGDRTCGYGYGCGVVFKLVP